MPVEVIKTKKVKFHNFSTVEIDTAIYGINGKRMLVAVVDRTVVYKRSYDDCVEIDHDIFDFLEMLSCFYAPIKLILYHDIRYLPGFIKFMNRNPDCSFTLARRASPGFKITERVLNIEIEAAQQYDSLFVNKKVIRNEF